MLICLLGSSSVYAQWKEADLDWTLKRDRKGIQVSLTKVPGSKFRAVYSTMQLEASAKQLAALVTDVDNCKKWASMCKAVEVVERVSPSETYVYSITNAPFPVRDRDMINHVKWFYDEVSGKIWMRSDATPERLPKEKGLVRVHYASSEWHFTPNGDGTVLVEHFVHVDPNGHIPAWLANLLIVDSPYKTLRNMRKLALQGAYRDTEVSFVPPSTQSNDESEIDQILKPQVLN